MLVFLSCNSYILVERQFGMEEHITNDLHVVSIDTVKYGIGFVKRVMVRVKQ